MPDKLKILHVCSTSAISGANRYAFDIAEGQADLGHSPTVCIPEEPGLSEQFRKANTGLEKIRAPYAVNVIRTVLNQDTDIVHCHGGKAGRWLKYVPKRFLPPAMVTIHSYFKKKHMSFFDGVHYLADWQKPQLDRFPRVTKKVNNWAPRLPDSSEEGARALRAEAGASDDDFLVGFLGRLDPVKAADDLIRGFKACTAENLKLAIVGDGVEKPKLDALAGDDPNISFFGFSSEPGNWYRAVDLLVMPSLHEPFALVALEAMSLNTPLLTSDLEGFQEILRDKPERRVDTTQPELLAAAIDAAAKQKTTPGIERADYDMSRFVRENGVAAVTDFYTEVIQQKHQDNPRKSAA